MNDLREQENIEALIQRFFAAFDNRNGRISRQDLMTELFAERAIIATHHDGHCDLYTPSEFGHNPVLLYLGAENWLNSTSGKNVFHADRR